MSEVRNIYFVRHGQTDANVGHIAQGSDSELTLEGKGQAQRVGKRLHNIPFGLLITSPYKRALQTAELIKDYSGYTGDIDTFDSLHERVKPSRLTGVSSQSEEYQEYNMQLISKAGDRDYRVDDGENFADMLSRAKEVIRYLTDDIEGDVVVVSHGYFLRIIIGYILTESEDLNMYATQIIQRMYLDNTGITHAKIDEKGHWQFGTINDSTHLS